MFSPFRDPQGAPRAFADVTFEDLAQLAGLEEGYALEYKREFTPSVRRKIPKIIASFANTSGGWLVVGVSDGDGAVCPIPRGHADFSQMLGELCRRHIVPIPRIDVRFIVDPSDADRGVVVVRVHEGDFPPYVADGVVEVREGSTSGPAVGPELVELYQKATRRRAEVAAFCRRTVFYRDAAQPLFNLYLFHIAALGETVRDRTRLNECAATMRGCFERQGSTCHVQHAHDSLLFAPSGIDALHRPQPVIELFDDESMKMSVPIELLDDMRRRELVAHIEQTRPEAGSPSDLRFMDSRDTLAQVTRTAGVLDRYVRERGIPWSEYAVAYELENMAGVMLWSDEEAYRTYIAAHGILSCATTDGISRVRYLDDGLHDSFRARQFAGSHFFEACGLPLGSPSPEDSRLVDALLSERRLAQ